MLGSKVTVSCAFGNACNLKTAQKTRKIPIVRGEFSYKIRVFTQVDSTENLYFVEVFWEVGTFFDPEGCKNNGK